jgi:uncharacterized repeat protein (TIGR01451 family)
MLRILRRFSLVLLAAGLAVAGGCSGTSRNSSYLPNLLPGGGPAGGGSTSLFGGDAPAVRLDVAPAEATNPVRTQHVLVATIYDAAGQPLRGRRVEWMIEGVGNVIEVDDGGGSITSRAGKVNNQYAVSFTGSAERRISRNNGNPADDFTVAPGQTWCVVSSAVEGDSHVTAYAPDISNWDAHKVFVTGHWVDADWVFPKGAVNRAGTQCSLTTGIFRHSDHQPLANYRVRYRVLDGPPAAFAPAREQEMNATSDLKGEAVAALAQVAPVMGVNRVGIEIIRPPDPSLPGGAPLVVGHGETTVEWQAAQVVLTAQGPPAVAVGAELVYTVTITNSGKVASQFLTVHDPIPQGLEYVRSDPPANREGTELIWAVPELPPGETRTFQVVFKSPEQTGRITNTATVVNRDGVKDQKSILTDIVAAQLQVRMTGPEAGAVAAPLTYEITVSNPGSGPAANVVLHDSFDAGLEHVSKANPVESALGALPALGSKTVKLVLTPRKTGRLVNRLEVTADGGLKASADHAVQVQEAKLTLKQTGPAARYVGRPAVWNIEVRNPGAMPINNVTLRDTLPAEVAFQAASDGGQVVGGQVVWSLGALQPGEQKAVRVETKCAKLAPQAVNVVTATADPGVQVQDEARLEIRGLPAFKMEVSDLDDPVEVNGKTTYKVEVTNQGTLPGQQVEITALVPEEMKVLTADGPTKPKIDGQKVTYPPLEALAPQQTVTYTVEVQALRPGDVRFQAELRSSMLSTPVVKQESTTIMAEPAGVTTGAPPPKPAPATPPAPAAVAPTPSPEPVRPVTPISAPAAPPSLPPAPSAPAPVVPPPPPAAPVGPPAPAAKPSLPPAVPAPAAPIPSATAASPAPTPPPALPSPALPSPALPAPVAPARGAPALPAPSDPLPPPPPLPSLGGTSTK